MEKAIRIAVFGLAEEVGGIETYLLNLRKTVKEKNIIFDFLMWHDTKQLSFEHSLEEEGSRFYRELYRAGEKKESEYMSFTQVLEKHPEWDGIYLNVPRIEYPYMLLVEAKKKGLPYRILHSHNSAKVEIHPGKRRKAPIWKMFYHLTQRSVVTNKFACSKEAGENLFGKHAAFRVMPNAIDFEKFQYDQQMREEMRNRYGIKPEDTVVGFVGRLTKEKNIPYLMDVFQELKKKKPDSRLMLVGDGNEREHLENLSEKMGIKEDVIFTGARKNTEDYYQAMDCFVLASLYEGFGIVLLEAQANGLQCYTSKNRVPESANITGSVIYLDIEHDPNVWAEEILKNKARRMDPGEKMKDHPYTLDHLRESFISELKQKEPGKLRNENT